MKKPYKKKPEEKKEETSLTDADYNRNKLFKKGVNLMADEKLEDAVQVFEQVLRIDPDNVDALLKLGYARFHLDDHLKALVHYEQKNYARALDSVEKSIESEPTFGMAWYNKACFLSLLNQIPESLEALKRAIEIDVKNAKRAVKDKDFVNVRVEEGFKRIVEIHREIRLWKIRLKDRGIDYLHENKKKMLDVFDDIEATVTQKLRNEVAQN